MSRALIGIIRMARERIALHGIELPNAKFPGWPGACTGDEFIKVDFVSGPAIDM